MRRRLLALVSVCSLALCGGQARGAAPGLWGTYFLLHHPVSVALPPGWTTNTIPPDAVFNAWNPQTRATLYVYVFSTTLTKTEFFAHVLSDAPSTYKQRDPNASFRHGLVTLPTGKALLYIVHEKRRIGSRIDAFTVWNYNVYHDGVGFDFVYSSPPPEDSVDIPVFEKSAQLIRFTD